MTLRDQLSEIALRAREHYMRLTEKHPLCSKEPLSEPSYDVPIRLPDDSPLLHDRYYVDHAYLVTEGCTLGNHVKQRLPCDLTVELAGNRRIAVKSIAWNGIRLHASDAELPTADLSAWLARWQGSPEIWNDAPATPRGITDWLWAASHPVRGDPGQLETKGVVHGVAVKDAKTAYIDFGSAPATAFDDLIDCLDEALRGDAIIDTEASSGDSIFGEVQDRLEENHSAEMESERDVDKVGRFLAWFGEEAASLASLASSARLASQQPCPEGEELDFRLEEAIRRLNHNIRFEVTPGETEHRLLLSCDGWAHLIPQLRALDEQLPAIRGWKIQVFRPREPVSDCLPTVATRTGEDLTFKPDEVHCALVPKVCTIDVLVYFDQHLRLDQLSYERACSGLIQRLLGELDAMSLGSVRAVRGRDDLGGAIPLTDFVDRYDAEARRIRESADAALKASAEALADWNYSALEPQIRVLETAIERFQPIIDSNADAMDTDAYVDIWARTEEQRSRIADHYDDHLPNCEELPCLAGDGWSIGPAAGSLLRRDGWIKSLKNSLLGRKRGFDLRAWLKTELAEISRHGGILLEIWPHHAMATVAPAELAAMELYDAGEHDKAIEILKAITEEYGALEEGRLDAKLGLWYMDDGDNLSAVAPLDLAIDLLTEEDANIKGEAFTNLGVALQNLGQLNEAIDAYRRSLTFDPESAPRSYNLGQAFAIVGDLHAALPHLRKAAETDEHHRMMLLEDTDLDPLRSEPEFQALVADISG